MRISLLILTVLLLVSCDNPKPRAPISVKKSTIYAETAKRLKSINKAEEAKILAYIENDSINSYEASPNGYWFTKNIEKDTESVKPKKADIVSFTYEIKDLNNQVIYSKGELGVKQYKVDKEDFITALQFGIKQMKVGETYTFIIPSFNAFGLTGDDNRIGVNQSLVVTLTLINIKENK